MGLFSSLYTSASGMMGQTYSTQQTSENIANMTTVGYKRSDVAFNDLLQTQTRYSRNVSGGVRGTEVQRVSLQGNIQQTSSATDLSIAGNGFFIVRPNADSSGELYFTRAGQFSPDANGILRNTAGFALYGYQTNTDGVAQGTGVAALRPIDLSALETAFYETTRIDARINLNSDQFYTDPHTRGTGQTLPLTGIPVDYTRSVTVYDSAGQGHDVRFEFRRTVGPMAHFTSDTAQRLQRDSVLVDLFDGPTPTITDGDQMVLSDGTSTFTVDFVNTAANTSLGQANTLNDLLTVINGFTNGAGDPVFLASFNSDSRLIVQSLNPSATLDISGSSPSVLGAGGFNIIPDPSDGDYIYAPEYNINAPGAGTAYPGQSDFPAFADSASPNAYNWWEMTVLADDGTGTNVIVSQGLLNFNGDGSLNAVRDANGASIFTLGSGSLPFDSTGGITVDLSYFSQYSGRYDTLRMDQNGAPLGEQESVTIRGDGLLYVNFSNGISLPAYQIPLALFNNPNGLEYVDGTAFRIPADGKSGEMRLALPGEGGSGQVNGYSLETSNVDIADEFGDLIVSQRVYSLNSQVIQAINEMTQTLSQLKG